jgi:hypothetical protein
MPGGTAGGTSFVVTSGIAIRTVPVLVLLGAVLAFVLTSCPANRDGMPGQLAGAKEQTQSASRSAALALDLWARGRSSRQLVSVQLTDARDEVAEAFAGIAILKSDDPVDLDRQAMLTVTMTSVIATLNRADAAVRGLTADDPQPLRGALVDSADALDRDYR